MPQEIFMDVEFNGDLETLIENIRGGEAFSYNGRPLPIRTAFVQGNTIVAPLPHRTLTIDLSDAVKSLKKSNVVRLNLRFVR